jgi:16S rRNA (adenine1518-N6/adenine1519-N6)-dimethyltransferase
MRPSDIYELLEKYQINAKKHLGQNFLADDQYLERITSVGNLDAQTGVIEIGPGLGSLTAFLIKRAGHVLSYEIDSDMVRILKENLKAENLNLIHADFLKADVDSDIKQYLAGYERIVVVANLPYYITTAILIKILEDRLPVETMVVMMQKEVADRISGHPDTKDYNALSVLIQYYTIVKKLFDVPGEAFIPHPDVMSTVVMLQMKKEKGLLPVNEDFFLKVNRMIFLQRRKTLVNNLNKALGIEKSTLQRIMSENNFEPGLRAESLSVEEIIRLSDVLYANINHEQQ